MVVVVGRPGAVRPRLPGGQLGILPSGPVPELFVARRSPRPDASQGQLDPSRQRRAQSARPR